jgi:hypothetical protein
MQYVLGNMLNGGGGLNPDGLSLDLQFAADKTLTARKGPTPVFTRGSTGTFVGSDGLIQSAAINTPRFDHTSAGVCRGLLIEESRTNICRYSGELVSGTGWTTVGMLSVGSGSGPDGNTAYEISETTGGTTHTFLNTGGTGSTLVASITSGVTYTGSIFLKKITGSVDWVQVTLASGGFGASQYVNIDISNGTVGNSSGGTARVEQYANGWYRVSWTATATTTTTTSGTLLAAGIQNTNGTTRVPSYSGSGLNKFLAAMAQLEVGSFPTSYIPTVASSVVRSADVCSITGADFSGMFNANDGTLFSNCSVDNTTGTNRGISSIRSTATFFMRQSLSNGSVRSEIRANDTQTNLGTTSVSILTAIKMALAYSGNDFASSTNGASPSLVTRTLPTGLSEFRIGSLDGTLCLNGHLVAIRYYRKRLSNAKLQALTA